jgi:hypothetical protein
VQCLFACGSMVLDFYVLRFSREARKTEHFYMNARCRNLLFVAARAARECLLRQGDRS